MKKYWGLFWAGVVGAALAAVVAAVVHVPGRTLLDFGFGAVSLFWLLIVTTVPWNLYFRARQVRYDIGVSSGRGIVVPGSRVDEVRRLERRLLSMAVGGHVVTAVVVAGVTWVSGKQLGYYFAAFYLLSCAIRPAAAYLGYLRARIAALQQQVRFPPDDVAVLKQRLAEMDAHLEAMKGTLAQYQSRTYREHDTLLADLRATADRFREDIRLAREAAERDRVAVRGDVEAVAGRMAALDARLAALVRRFDEAVDGLTDQQELLGGIRAFVRLVKADAAGG